MWTKLENELQIQKGSLQYKRNTRILKKSFLNEPCVGARATRATATSARTLDTHWLAGTPAPPIARAQRGRHADSSRSQAVTQEFLKFVFEYFIKNRINSKLFFLKKTTKEEIDK